MFITSDQFYLNVRLLRGLAAMGANISPAKQAQKQLIAKLLVAELLDPRTTYVDHNAKTMYVAEIKMFCPDLFH